MNKVWLLPASENWICDRFVQEWNEDNVDITVLNPISADVIWLLSDWRWREVPFVSLAQKKVLTSVHHITPEKFGWLERQDFAQRDKITTAYHVYNQHTYDVIRPLTEKPIHLVHYWANNKLWKPTGTKEELRRKHGLPIKAHIVGSFQRDTEGQGISSGVYLPKREKGPDLLCDYLEGQHKMKGNWDMHVLLAGWRRQYVIERLKKASIPYTYFERPEQEVVNELYQTLDIYPVTARYEGGPQSLIECGLLDVPVVSRPVGIAEQVLPASAIHDDVSQATAAIPNVEAWKLPAGYQPYRDLLQSL